MTAAESTLNLAPTTSRPARRPAVSCRAAALASLCAAVLVGTSVPAPAEAAGGIESMPLWRVQVRVITGDTESAGTTGKPAFRFNGTSTGVRTLNPPSTTAFGKSQESTHDLRHFDTPSQMTMLRIGIAGTDEWCIRKTELILNNRVAFSQEAVPGSPKECKPIRGGTYLEYSYSQMRNNPSWRDFGSPPALPSGMSAATMHQMVTSVTGSAMLSSPLGIVVTWDPARPLRIVRRTTTTVAVSYGVIVYATGESPEKAVISYDLRLYVGGDGNLHAFKTNASCCHHYSMTDNALAQVNTALSRMSARPAPHAPLRFTIDSFANVSWTYTA